MALGESRVGDGGARGRDGVRCCERAREQLGGGGGDGVEDSGGYGGKGEKKPCPVVRKEGLEEERIEGSDD